MLEDSLFESLGRQKTRKPLTVIISGAAHIVTIGVLLVIPLMQTQGVTLEPVDLSLWAPVTDQPVSEPVSSREPQIQPRIQMDPNALTAPEAIPPTISYVDAPHATSILLPPSAGGSPISSILDFLVKRNASVEEPTAPVPPPPPPPPPIVEVTRIRTGGAVQQGKIIHQVNPTYPPLARQARIQGAVLLEAVIAKDGSVRSLRVISGHPLLTQGALDAVQQWRYHPTLLNGEPVEVLTTITVTFTLR